MFIDVGARRSWDGAMDRLAGAASKILPSCNLLHKAENFMIFLIAKTIVVNKKIKLFQTKYWFTYCNGHKLFVPDQKMISIQ